MKKTYTYPYLVSLALSFLIVGCAWKLGYIHLDQNLSPPPIEEASPEPPSAPEVSETSDTQAADIQELSDTENSPVEAFDKEAEPEIEVSPFFVADRSYFEDALFIGDSRTVGLYEYGDLGNAVVLADTGMSVYKLFKRSFPITSGEQLTLEELLSQKQFGKIYIMLGINELGYDFEQTVGLYRDMVASIEAMQPDAILFLQANLHITEKKSNSSPIYNNANINRFNAEIQNITDSKKRFYLDANELFDDENGNLSTEYTADESHVLGKYYADWVNWILTYAVKNE